MLKWPNSVKRRLSAVFTILLIPFLEVEVDRSAFQNPI